MVDFFGGGQVEAQQHQQQQRWPVEMFNTWRGSALHVSMLLNYSGSIVLSEQTYIPMVSVGTS